jgi:hypothetical protein
MQPPPPHPNGNIKIGQNSVNAERSISAAFYANYFILYTLQRAAKHILQHTKRS